MPASPAASDGEYFFKLLARMTQDVERQPENAALNPARTSTLATLRAIGREAPKRKPKPHGGAT
jgi:hypothetical protein